MSKMNTRLISGTSTISAPYGVRNWRWKPDALHRVDRKSTRLNSSHGYISYAVFCLKKKIGVLERGRQAGQEVPRRRRHRRRETHRRQHSAAGAEVHRRLDLGGRGHLEAGPDDRLGRQAQLGAAVGDRGRDPVTFFFNGPAGAKVYALSLHDALPI